MACVKRDKFIRRPNKESFGVQEYAIKEKREWTELRNFALEIAPRLADRLPHFSEFEPLKSHKAEELLQKKSNTSLSDP